MTFWRMLWLALGITVALLLCAALGGVALALLENLIDGVPGLGWLPEWAILPLIFVLWSWLPAKFRGWPCTYEIRGSAIIDAPPSAVWRLVFPQPGKDYFLNTVQEIKAVEGSEDRVDLVFDPETIGQGLPHLEAQIEEVEPQSYFRVSYLNGEAFPLWTGDLVKSEYWLEHAGDKTRLTMIETLDKLRVSTVLALLFLNPCKDAMKTVQALCTGQQDTSRMARMHVQFDPNTEEGVQTAKTINGLAIMVCVLLTVMCIGFVKLLLSV